MAKSDTSKSKRMLSLLKAYEKGGLSVSKFCTERGLTKSTFYYWQKRYRAAKVSSNAALVPVQFIGGHSRSSVPDEIEIAYFDGTRIFIPGSASAELIRSLLPGFKQV